MVLDRISTRLKRGIERVKERWAAPERPGDEMENELDGDKSILVALQSINRQVGEAAHHDHAAVDSVDASTAPDSEHDGDAGPISGDLDSHEKIMAALQSIDRQVEEAIHHIQAPEVRTSAAPHDSDHDLQSGPLPGWQDSQEKIMSTLQNIDRQVAEALNRNQVAEDAAAASKTFRFWVDVAAITVGLLAGIIFYRQQESIKNEIASITAAAQKTSTVSHADERAVIAIASIDKTLVPHRSGYRTAYQYAVLLKNIGGTAANDISVHAGYFVLPRDFGTDAPGISAFQDAQLLGKISPANIAGADVVSTVTIPKTLLRAGTTPQPFVMIGKEPITPRDGVERVSYLIGRVDYADAFRARHWLKFCYVVTDSDGVLQSCAMGNAADQTPETQP